MKYYTNDYNVVANRYFKVFVFENVYKTSTLINITKSFVIFVVYYLVKTII